MNNPAMQTVYWTHFAHHQRLMYIAATEKGLCYIGSPDAAFNEFTSWLRIHLPHYQLTHNSHKLQVYADQLKEYIQGSRKLFGIQTDLHGTAFQKSVWKALMDIPYGETISYSSIASQLQKPNAVRAVASAIGKNPVLIVVPCHRVIGKSGALTGYRGGLAMKAELLQLEKIERRAGAY